MYNEDQLFSKWAAEMYDRDETGAEDVDFALYLIGLRPRRVLDVACGSGRFLVPLARAGHTAEGFDFDPAMLERIPRRAGDTGGFKVRQADAVRDIWGGGFDVVLLAANLLFNIVSDTMSYPAAQRLLIDKAAAALRPGGMCSSTTTTPSTRSGASRTAAPGSSGRAWTAADRGAG